MSFKKHKLSRFFGILFAAVFAVSMCIPAAADNSSAAGNTVSVSAEEHISELLAAGDYTEGEALAVVSESYASGKSVQGILSGAEDIASVSREAYEEYADANFTGTDFAVSSVSQNSGDYKIVLITDTSRTTKEILEDLYATDGVLFAEPNYLFSIEDEDSSEEISGESGSDEDIPDEDVFNGDASDEDASEEDASDESASEGDASEEDASDESASEGDASDENASDEDASGDETADDGSKDDGSDSDDASNEEKSEEAADKSDEKAAADENKTDENDLTEEKAEAAAESTWTRGVDADATDYQWAYNNDGTKFWCLDGHSVAGVDINDTDWNTYDGTEAVQNATGVIAVVDSGIDYTNPDLADVMMSDMKQYNSDGGDYGYNASDGDVTDPMDLHGHGTHCAGIIAAEWNNTGVSGTASGVKLVACRVAVQNTPYINVLAVIQSYQYLSKAMDNGLQLVAINNSWGGSGNIGDVLGLMVDEVGRKGAISAFAAGNSAIDHNDAGATTNSVRFSPYAVIVDSAMFNGDESSFSDYGSYSTDVFAPGSYILSTAPIANSKYRPELDTNPIFSDQFHEDTDIIITKQTTNEKNVTIVPETVSGLTSVSGVARSTEYGYENKDSLLFDLDQFDTAVAATGELDNTKAFIMYIPVEKDKIASADTLCFYQTSDSLGITMSVYLYMEQDGKRSWENGDETQTGEGGGWICTTVDLSEEVSSGASLATIPGDDEDTAYVPVLCIPQVGEDASIEGQKLVIDYINISNHTAAAPYVYMSGTSMATPVITGCAGVIAKRQLDKGETICSADSAKERANILKASVAYYSSYDGLCRQNGMIDLSVTEDNYTPVINTVSNDSSAGRLTIKGAYFGESGTVTVDGTDVTVVSWSDTSITINLPDGFETGFKTITVTASNGKSGRNGFIVAASAAGDYFENVIDLSAINIDDTVSAVCTGYNGKLYFLGSSAASGLPTVFFSYDPSSGTCTELATMLGENDNSLTNPSLALYDGAIYCYLENYISSDERYGALYKYDISANTWTKIESTDLPGGATLVNVNSKLYLMGGAKDEEAGIRRLEISDGSVSATLIGNFGLAGTGAWKITAYGNSAYALYKYTANISLLFKVDLSERNAKVDLLTASGMKIGSNAEFGITTTANGIVISGGRFEEADGDTFTYNESNATFDYFGKDAFPDVISPSNCYAYDGQLYTWGSTAAGIDGDNGIITKSFVMRSTACATSRIADDLIPAGQVSLDPSADASSKGGVKDKDAAIAAVGYLPTEIYRSAVLGIKANDLSLVSDGYITKAEYQKVLDYVNDGGSITAFDIRVTALDETSVPADDKALLAAASDYTQAQYWDISIYLKGDDNEDVARINKLDTAIDIGVLMDGSLIVSNRSFRTYKVHGGEASSIKATIGAQSHILSFSTAEFSTYSLAYKDQESTPTPTVTTTPTATPTATTSPSSSGKGSSVSTGDSNNMTPFVVIIVAAAAVIAVAVVVMLRKKKQK